MRTWIKDLESAGKNNTGFGYEIEWTLRNHRETGRNLMPARVVVPSEADALRLLNQADAAERFHRLTAMSLQRFPKLEGWLTGHPFTALEHAADWERVLDVLAWFVANPASGLYLRQVEIGSVDTKFIEERKGLFWSLLDAVTLPPSLEHAEPSTTFERRFGLSQKPSLIRFRLLDKKLYIAGLSELAIPSADFARLSPEAQTVFITENEINGVAFPDLPSSLVIFGLGYGLERLSQAVWLAGRDLYYWGDIDTHGFAMLDRLRAIFPHVKSFLMDRYTLLLHQASWVREQDQYRGGLARLSVEEKAVFDGLKRNTFGTSVRLEQERISFSSVRSAFEHLRLTKSQP